MNRMFVRDSGRGLGLGRMLVKTLIKRAREMGFHTMILTALPRHREAIPLYQSCGFTMDDRARDTGDSDNSVRMKLKL